MGILRGSRPLRASGTTRDRWAWLPRLLIMALILSFVPITGSPLHPDAALADNGLTVTMTATNDPAVGGQIVYTIKVTNTSFAAGALNPDGKAYNLDLSVLLPLGNVLPSDFTPLTASNSVLEYVTVNGQQRNQYDYFNLTDIARNQTVTYTLTVDVDPAIPPARC